MRKIVLLLLPALMASISAKEAMATSQYVVTAQSAFYGGGIYPGSQRTLLSVPTNSGMVAGDIVLSVIVDPASPGPAGQTTYDGPYQPGQNVPIARFNVVTVPAVPQGATVSPAAGPYLQMDESLGVPTGASPIPIFLLLMEHP
jgi:hypothetical protein